MKFLEKDLEEIIFTESREALLKCGLRLPERLRRQLRIGNYGRADIVGFEAENMIGDNRLVVTIYELKQDKISVSAFLQAIGYARGIQSYFSKKGSNFYDRAKINIVLIGKDIDNHSSFIYLPDMLDGYYFSLKLYTYDLSINGLTFKEHSNYKLVKEGF